MRIDVRWNQRFLLSVREWKGAESWQDSVHFVTIDRCVLSGNSARQGWTFFDGGAIYVVGSALVVDHCQITGNSGRNGSAVYAADSTGSIRDSTFRSNLAYDSQAHPSNDGVPYARVDNPAATATVAQWQMFETVILSNSRFFDNGVRNRTADHPSVGLGGTLALMSITKLRVTETQLLLFMGVATVWTAGTALAGCRDVGGACAPGSVCQYSNFSIFCRACGGGNQISTDGLSCQNCPAGTGVSSSRTTCEACSSGFASVHGLCERCPAGKEPSLARTGCLACASGKCSADGVACVQCAAGAEPNVNSPGATSCVACAHTEFSPTGLQCSRCKPQAGPASEPQPPSCCAEGHS
jgi:hypothetical protein